MYKNCVLIALLLLTGNAFAEISGCNVGGEAVFTIIVLNTEAKTAVITDKTEHKLDGQITQVRDQGKGFYKYNVSFEYKMNNAPIHIDMIIVPVGGDAYRVGVAGYIKKGKKDYLDFAGNDEALCY